MSEQSELWICPQCGTQQDIAALGFYAEINCPQCGKSAHVHCMLANYKVDSILGIGGMSVVFQVQDLVLERPLAVKVLNETYRDAPERISGFENECSLMAKVRHENVVAVYSAGWARGQFYIVMELVDGRNLELIVAEQGAMKPLEAIEIIRQVARGLRAAHAAGILHRDVKPGNVLITAAGQAKVLDFGLSQEEKTDVESKDIIWATPYYVAPETLRREDENVQADIYALGMLLRNLLTGESTLPNHPQTVPDMLVAKKTLLPIGQLLPGLSAPLCKLVDTMTAFEIAERPKNYDEVLKLVEAVQSALYAEADPETRIRSLRRKLYVTIGAAASVLVGMLGAFAVSHLTPEQIIHESLASDTMVWSARDNFNAAAAAMKAGDLAKAAEFFGSLTSEDTDPAISAAAVMLRTAMDVLEGKSSANGYQRFAEVAARAEKVSPLGRVVFEKISALMTTVGKDSARAAEMAARMGNPLLKAAAYILVADQAVHSGNFERAEQLMTEAKSVLAMDELAGLRTSAESYASAAPRRAVRALLQEVKEMFRKGQYIEAAARGAVALQQAVSPQEKNEINVLNEASAMMQAVQEALQKKNCKVYLGMNPSDLLTAAAGVGTDDKLPKEFYCIALLLAGDYDVAFRENPYAADDASQEPFAVMMRDWKKRLGK